MKKIIIIKNFIANKVELIKSFNNFVIEKIGSIIL